MEPCAVATVSKVGGGMIASTEHPFRGQKTLHAHRATRVDPSGTNTDLGAKSEPKTVRKSRTRIVEDARTVHALLEAGSELFCKKIALEKMKNPNYA